MKIGAVIRVLRPEYAIGLIGVIEGYEEDSKRWIVRLDKNYLKDKDSNVILSLSELDFDVIKN